MADIQSTSNPSSSHQALYKHNGVSTNLLHQKHREETVELRKKKRDDSFARTRRLLELSRDQVVEPALRSVFDQDLINDLTSTDDERVFLALQTYARLFSSSECVDQMHEIELVKVIVEIFMRSEPFTSMESVCVIVLSKLSNDFDRITCFLNAGVISKLINSFGSTNLESLEHAVFLLEEIVRHDSNTRSICTNLEILPASVKLYLNYDQLSLRRQILTLICNYFDFEVPLYEISKELLEFLHYVILNEADELLLSDAFDILTKITQFSSLHANLLVNDGFLGEAISFLNGDVAHSCMMFVKAIASYGEEHIKVLADLGYLEQIWNIASSTGNST
ncbi:Importin subunit alpha [Aphelenchoides bicaudatus]|nr:Importin subunit alpha [Aphelenchoides bicaudatus]